MEKEGRPTLSSRWDMFPRLGQPGSTNYEMKKPNPIESGFFLLIKFFIPGYSRYPN